MQRTLIQQYKLLVGTVDTIHVADTEDAATNRGRLLIQERMLHLIMLIVGGTLSDMSAGDKFCQPAYTATNMQLDKIATFLIFLIFFLENACTYGSNSNVLLKLPNYPTF